MDLLAVLHASLSPLFLGQVKNLHKIVAADFSKSITAGLKAPGYDFSVVVNKGKEGARERFLAGARGESLNQGSALQGIFASHESRKLI